MSPIYTFFSSLFSPLFLYFIFYITHFIIRSSTILLIKSFILLSYHFHHPILYPVIFSSTYSFPGFLFFFSFTLQFSPSYILIIFSLSVPLAVLTLTLMRLPSFYFIFFFCFVILLLLLVILHFFFSNLVSLVCSLLA